LRPLRPAVRSRSRPLKIETIPRAVAFLIALLTLGHISFGGARLAITLQAVHLHASPFTVGLLVSLLMLVPSFVAVHVGRWVDRAGYIRPALLGTALMVAGEAAAAAVPSVAALAAASVLVGTGFMFCHVSVNNVIGHIVSGDLRTRAYGLTALGYSFSAFAGPLIAGYAIDLAGHQGAFLVLVVPGLLSLAFIVRGIAPAAAGPTAIEASDGAMGLLRVKPLRSVLVVSALISAGWDLFTFLAPLHGARSGLSATQIGIVAGAFGAGAAAMRLALPWLMRRFSERQLLRFALVASALGYFAFPFSRNVATMLPLAVWLGMVLGCGQPIVMSLLHATAPAGRTGEAVGLRTAITSFGQTWLPLASGAMGAALGLLPLFWAIASLLGLGGAMALSRRKS
jgi:MFS family permease